MATNPELNYIRDFDRTRGWRPEKEVGDVGPQAEQVFLETFTKLFPEAEIRQASANRLG